MKRPFWLLLAAVFWLAACQAPAPAATRVPTQKPAEQRPAEKPTEAPALPAHPAPATRAPLPTALPGFNPPISGGVLNPPTHVPTPGNNPAGATIRQNLWQQEVLTNTPPARYDHAFAFEFEVYTMIAFGGQAQSALGDTWIYSQSKWFKLSPKTTPPPRFGAEAAYTSGSYPLIFGGQSAKQFFNDVWKYNGPAQKWEQIATTGNGPAPRAGATLGVETNPLHEPYHNLLFVTHGYSDREYFNDTLVLDLTANTWREISPASRPSKRKGQAGTFDDQQGKLFLFGGQDVVGNLLGDLWELDPAKRTWTKITPRGSQPSPRSSASLTYDFNGRLWLFGGETTNGVTNELWMYDIASKQWSLIDSSDKPAARSRHKSACSHDSESCYVFGGLDAHSNALNDLWQFTP